MEFGAGKYVAGLLITRNEIYNEMNRKNLHAQEYPMLFIDPLESFDCVDVFPAKRLIGQKSELCRISHQCVR